MISEVIQALGLATIGGWMASIEYRIRANNQALCQRPTRDEVKEDIETHTTYLQNGHKDIKEDLRRLEDKIDRLINRLSK